MRAQVHLNGAKVGRAEMRKVIGLNVCEKANTISQLHQLAKRRGCPKSSDSSVNGESLLSFWEENSNDILL